MSRRKIPLPDRQARERIMRELDRTMLVEAAAGTGKTKSMVDRMISLLREGKCRVDTLAAVTFTRKAAAELRSRFQVALEDGARREGPGGDRLREALSRAEACFIGTIHSFCARLLRERPVEAGVTVDFTEMDEEEDSLLRGRAWDECIAAMHASDDPVLARLEELGLEAGDLRDAFDAFSAHQDVSRWPADPAPLPDLSPAAGALRNYARHMETLVPTLPADPGRDELMPAYRRIPRILRQADLNDPAELMEALSEFREGLNVTLRNWPLGAEQGRKEKGRWLAFAGEHAAPLLAAWREHRYAAVIEFLRRCSDWYVRLRRSEGRLNFQDLLMRAAGLLRERPAVRGYFRERWSHLLVDEFQDTDPVQAEVMLLLTAADPRETDWRRCLPVPGSLFVVGDPKQSIYRFRRADIVTYSQVRKVIEKSGGEVVHLTANFRSGKEILEWVNGVFERHFPSNATPESPPWVPLETGVTPAEGGGARIVHVTTPSLEPPASGASVRIIRVPPSLARNEQIVPWTAEFAARVIRRAVEGKEHLPRTAREVAAGVSHEAQPGDFLIITPHRSNLGEYSSALRELGIPHEVTGGAALNTVPELSLLRTGLAAVIRPEDPVALVAALRSPLFGFTDSSLYRYRRAGGRFSYLAPVPGDLSPGDAEAFSGAFSRLRGYALLLARVPSLAALETMASDLGLFAAAAAEPGGNEAAGSLGRAMELLRASRSGSWTAADMLDHLERLVAGEEKYDGLAARPSGSASVRVMNLHKVKGLEAAVVFLADPTGERERRITLHIDRSAPEPAGYLAVHGPGRGWAPPPLLAQPPGWKTFETRERAFQEAEKLRLLYVAATRASARLIITLREDSRKGSNPWGFFEPHAARLPEMTEPPEHEEPGIPSAAAVTAGEAARASAAADARRRHSARPTYEVRGAKELSVGLAPPAVPGEGGDGRGAEWGTCIHRLLDAAMRYPGRDLLPLASAVLEEQGLDPALAIDALGVVGKVSNSELWRRALASPRHFVEVPFQVHVPAGTPPAGALPLFLRGVIDLAFWEDAPPPGGTAKAQGGGWIIVDYKTDDRARESVEALATHYAPQVRLYADTWSRITGQPVRGAFLYFVNTDRLVPA